MIFSTFLKQYIEKTIFIEINEDITLDIPGKPTLKKGEYPILQNDIIKIANENLESFTPSMLIDGMITIIACDPDLKYVNSYIQTIKSIEGIESYIIMQINNERKNNLKRSVILSGALERIYPRKENSYNRILLLMELYEKANLSFIETEIIESLERICENYPDFKIPFYHLGEYYVKKDIDKAKIYLRKCLDDPEVMDAALEILNEIESSEKFDDAVEYVKAGQGIQALKILIPICEYDPDNLDAKYYIAVAYRQTGNNTKALIYLKELLDFAERAEVYSEIGINLAELQEHEAALEYFKKALKITPDDIGIICNIGVCHLNLNDLDSAQKTFALAHRLNPKDEIAASWLKKLSEQ